MDKAQRAELRQIAAKAPSGSWDNWLDFRSALSPDRITALLDRCDRLEEALERFSVLGIPRIDHTPTRFYDRENAGQMVTDQWWQEYFNRANENVKQDARAALTEGDGQ